MLYKPDIVVRMFRQCWDKPTMCVEIKKGNNVCYPILYKV